MRSNSRVITAIFLGGVLSLVPAVAFCAEGSLLHLLDGRRFEAADIKECSVWPKGKPSPEGPCTVIFSETGEWEFMHGDVGEGGKFTVDRSGDITVSGTQDKFTGHFDADKNELMWGRSGEAVIKFIERKNPKE